MRKINFKFRQGWGILFLFLLLIPPFSQAATAPEGIIVSYLEDKAQFRTNAAAPWQALEIGQRLFPYYELQTHAMTRVTLRLGDGSEVRVAPNTHMRINPQTDETVSNFDFQLMIGKAWAKFRKNVKLGAKLILRTAHAKINIRGTSYEATVSDEQTRVRVFNGQVVVSGDTSGDGNEEIAAPTEITPPQEVSREAWQVIVSAFYTISVSKNQPPQLPQRFALETVRDEWVAWNLNQDQTLQ